MKIFINEEEKKNILGMHVKKGYNTLNENKIDILGILKEQYTKDNVVAVQKALINNKISVGPKGADGQYGNDTINAIKTFQRKKGLSDDGQVGPCTAKSLGVKPLVGSGPCKDPNVKAGNPSSNTTSDTSKDSGVKTPEGYDCIAVDAKTCKAISPNFQTPIGSGAEKQCTAYARKCLNQYGVDYLGGSAWQAFDYMKGKGGKVKYNMFDGNYNFNNLQSKLTELIKSKNFKGCSCFSDTPGVAKDVDMECDGKKLAKSITDSYPSKPSFDISQLQLGDIVGLYWRDSGNKGKAFCQIAGVDKAGKINNNKPINTHLGFVGAIKNGNPIIFHNVHGQHLATPAKDYLSKTNPAMITWVITDPDISEKLRPEPDTFTKYFNKALSGISKIRG